VSTKQEWLEKVYKRSDERPVRFSTLSDMEVEPLYTPEDVKDDYNASLGQPGEYPYTRGVYESMYRGRLWTMRQFAGFGLAEDTNERFRFLLAQGQDGLSTAFDMPTLMGYDADHERSMGEVGREGVNVTSIHDVARLFDQIPMGKVSTSMTVNCSASALLAMYLVQAERTGVPWSQVSGTIQNDMLKEFTAQKEWICPPAPSLRIVTDMVEFCAKKAPRFHPVSISGYHIREAGSTAVQELAFTIADGLCYVQDAVSRGIDVDDFAPRLSFFWDLHSDFLEEVAKLRAGRRMWARFMKERFGAKNPRSMMLRTHAQTAGVSLTAQQPMNNVVRVAIQALAGVLGGVQSLHTNSMDETLALPTEQSVMVALRTQQIIAEETGVTNTIDPLGGSYAVEALTDRMEREAMDYINKIDEMGGMLKAIEVGYPQREIAEAAFPLSAPARAGRQDRGRRQQVFDSRGNSDRGAQDRSVDGRAADSARAQDEARAQFGRAQRGAEARRRGLPLGRKFDGTDLRRGAPGRHGGRDQRHLSRRVRRVQRPGLDLAGGRKEITHSGGEAGPRRP
jgi:methylmalonyl-CoA mutase N-terminal domain/subunit